MKNKELATDYLKRCQNRLLAIDTLYTHESWADVVRESQEVVELALKGLLRFVNIEVPRVHDVGLMLKDEIDRLPPAIQKSVNQLARISHQLRRDRELAFYGSDDLTPSQFYVKDDATTARKDARWVVSKVADIVLG